ncbi:5-formyltetrahydrofolate cyclo-ligase [Paraferrimonas sedimenticola]|uniref:5-formyltetrahydrofolate cyclo-ligase n=1 Tax=Paraferrimonas sedimenticola TaxID=375674 RepID=A0AA37RVA8_9GAMM|nr:5-formyltetrahydrofolate cyclo-ligase [Paraferrimonas sedimenticola]GLP95519.1 5-formyltetrahydrofolate cyclo-ligase [Paraferrimonas sedimenticola]
MDTRQAIRQQMRDARRALSAEQQTQAEHQLATQLVNFCALKQLSRVALYLSFDGEIGTKAAIQALWQADVQVALPILHPFSQGHLLFIDYRPDTPMRCNRYGIQEPQLDCSAVIPLAQLDAIFTPLVAFDSRGNRLGMGGGFYDRTLASDHAPKAYGLAHPIQEQRALPVESWDQPLHGIITSDKIFEL